jgi:hypothetical protein
VKAEDIADTPSQLSAASFAARIEADPTLPDTIKKAAREPDQTQAQLLAALTKALESLNAD